MPLETYHKKRKFDETPEPSGRVRTADRREPIFVVQKHDATNLHYDFRLQIEGVLASWAVPRGPSANPKDKRLAILTEDHPLEYADFEGVIPEAHYGAGTVMVWDRGAIEFQGASPAREQFDRGEIKAVLHGSKLKGGFVLIRSGASGTKASPKERWLLIKQRDEHADREWNVEGPALGRSVVTGRTLDDIAHGRPAKSRTGGAH